MLMNVEAVSTMNSAATIIPTLDFSIYDVVTIEFDNDWYVFDAQDEAHVEVSTDGGTTWVGVWIKLELISETRTRQLISLLSLPEIQI